MLGPADVKVAQEEAPNSLRAQYTYQRDSDSEEAEEEGTETMRELAESMNLLHGSADEADVERDMQFFFPIERTVAAIKPEAYANREEIIELIRDAGFHIAARKDTQVSTEVCQKMYRDVKDKPFYGDLINHMTRSDLFESWLYQKR